MTRHRYPLGTLMADYARAAPGLALTLPPLLLVATSPIVSFVLAVLAALFAGFALSTLARQRGVIVLQDDGITAEGMWRRHIAWDALRSARLRWFGPRHDRRDGAMQLVLKGGRRRLVLDSRIDGFETIAAAAAAAAQYRGLPLTAATIDNFAALGIALGNEIEKVDHRGTETQRRE
jgi:hypothetical protein